MIADCRLTAEQFATALFESAIANRQSAMKMSPDPEIPKTSTTARPAPVRRSGPALETRLVFMALAAGFPAILVALFLLWTGIYSSQTRWTLAIIMVVVWLGFSFALRGKVAYPLQTLSNLLSALREEDYSIRARGTRPDSAWARSSRK